MSTNCFCLPKAFNSRAHKTWQKAIILTFVSIKNRLADGLRAELVGELTALHQTIYLHKWEERGERRCDGSRGEDD
jgi:hypothetical protein